MFWVIFIIALVVLGSIAIIFDTGFLGAIGIVIGLFIVCALAVYLINKISTKHPEIGTFLSNKGKKFAAYMFFGGLIMAVIGFFIDAGSEVKSYTDYHGNTVSYIGDAISSVLWIGFIVAFVGAVVFISVWFISDESSPNTYKKNPVPIDNASVGKVVNLGQYNQSNNEQKESIRWIVLEEKRDRLLLISEKVLNGHCYNKKDGHITWENCDLRKWLNEKFIEEAFTKSEQERLLTTLVKNPKNLAYGIDGGNETYDKLFVLSVDEFNKYLHNNPIAKCKPTQFAINRNVIADPNYDNCCCWWLRTPGKLGRGCFVFYDGTDNGLGEAREKKVGIFLNGVRPAMWVKK